MTKGRKTTFEERVEIVQYCIAHDCDYAKTAEKYQVSYQQARSYTLKYQEKGVEGLQDRRADANQKVKCQNWRNSGQKTGSFGRKKDVRKWRQPF